METVRFENGYGLTLAGDYWKAKSRKGIVMAHGFSQDRKYRGRFETLAEKFNEAGFNVLTFDFSGCGESERTAITAEKQVQDLEAAIEYMKSRGAENIGLFGHSLGGYIALRNHNEVDALVLTAPVTYGIDLPPNRIWELSINLFGKLPSWSYLKRSKKLMWIGADIVKEMRAVNQKKLLSEIKCSVLIIQGDEDPVISMEKSKDAVNILESADLEVVEGLNHDYGEHIDVIGSSAVSFFEEKL
ncbi:alpha/beta hydrolase [Candidatus Nanohalococcus occultus]|uniref:Alpha/beta superfamily hydrolase n=1 Tax=Candidatus Nanohalococcus occultus TaxID=2978047 RepID=A0ABY8CEU4_9ARCH|nr:Alpha/beta superfamily hydrolase [Candidatus Nanohaloarchaeota archaeon SVXNc]